MIFIVSGILLVIAFLITILGSIFKKRKVLLFGIYIILVLIVCSIIYGIYAIESKIEEENNINISEESIIKTPNRIIYKNENNEYYILDSSNANFTKLFSEVYKRIDKTIEGKVLSKEEIKTLKKYGTFLEFDYISASKNYIFPLDEEEIGMIRMFEESGQVQKIKLQDRKEFKKKIKNLTKNIKPYEFVESQIYTSRNIVEKQVIEELKFKADNYGIYKLAVYETSTYQEILNKTKIEIKEKVPNVDFKKRNVLFIISKYRIESVEENIGNIKLKFSEELDGYHINMLIVSKVVNINCVYCDIKDVEYKKEIENSDETSKVQEIRGVIENNSSKSIEYIAD